MSKNVFSTNDSVNFPKGWTMTDNRIEDYLQRFLKPSEYCVWRIYLRYWGGDKSVAYPSLSRISKSTGLSEKTIRTVNKELVRKGYLKYRSGSSNRSNQYYYITIDELMKKYYSSDVPKDELKDVSPITQYDKVWDTKELNLIYSKLCDEVKHFYNDFKTLYRKKMGMNYVPSKADLKSISNLDFKTTSLKTYNKLLNTFFYCRNKYIENSDYTIFFFTRSKTQQLIMKEYVQTDEGRWRVQAENHWKFISKNLGKFNFNSKEEIEQYIREVLGSRISGANKVRDVFVIDYLIDKLTTQQ